MNLFYIVKAKKLKQILLIGALAFITAWIFFLQNTINSPVFSTANGPKAVYKGEKDIALTFNIGWGDEKAEPILDQLKKQNVKAATFFLSGSWAERHPHIVERIVKDGYEIGMLGYNYKDYSVIEDKDIVRDISKAQEAFKKLNIKNIELLRAPTGHFDKRLLEIGERFGYTVVHWSVDSKDWTNPGVENIVSNIEKAKKGDIILLHASDSAKQTVVALPSILQAVKSKNLKLVTVSEMIANTSAKSEEIK
ncbi:polysaccharide deacetylase family sporulation protein PdaB [Peribacillus alkalitolerans]|uniref:polysaccharide deacetylase family sporulation protein PdaB n=1 Tax=Peribacillus alkalitolerans TaxID=1550385 RepID=UPI0013CFCBC6|nr:polysaccharide deacetylase family sporulation protein PdaB [Peribacillus alkalitolerans]